MIIREAQIDLIDFGKNLLGGFAWRGRKFYKVFETEPDFAAR